MLPNSVHTEGISVWTVFFMRKFANYLWICALVLAMFSIGGLIADRHTLKKEIIRLHVVANSDCVADQEVKLSVRDAITDYIEKKLPKNLDITAAKENLSNMLIELEAVAKETLISLDCQDDVEVSLMQESFGKRDYDTFSLPSGIYESLRVRIGSGKGQNWWCVIFPGLCAPVTSESFVDAAVTGGMNRGLANTLSKEGGYEVRFFLLDLMGRIENFFHFG